MNRAIKQLLELQRIDQELQRLRERLEKVPQVLEREEADIVQLQKEIAQLEEEVKAQKAECSALEKVELGELDKQIAKRKQEKFSVKTNEALRALESTIASLESQRDALEERILALLEEVEEKEQRLEQLRENLKKREAQFQERKKEVEEDLAFLREEYAQWQAKRDEALKTVPREVLNEYERLLTSRPNPVVEVKDQTCQGCFTRIPLNVVEQVILREELIFCPSCARILFVKGELSKL